MPGIARFNDSIITGHIPPCDVNADLAGVYGSGVGVFVNSKGVQVNGDPVGPHTHNVGNQCLPHIAFISGGSSSVFVGGRQVARIGDSADTGVITGGSTNVFAGG